MSEQQILVRVRDLRTEFKGAHGTVCAVDQVSFDIHRGETLALLGESGCGKTVTALSLMRLLPEPAGQITNGEVWLEQQNLFALPEQQMRAYRGKRIGMIFQEPMTSLNPVMRIGKQIMEALPNHPGDTTSGRQSQVINLLGQVGIPDPERRSREYPHQLSGGMKQRVMIAIALAGEPDLLIADEPTTALDVTTQAQILRLLQALCKSRGMALLLVTHDLAVVAQVADRIAIMYAGQIVEQADRQQFFSAPAHPYSQRLFHSLPSRAQRGRPLQTIPGTVPRPGTTPKGCRFAARCHRAWSYCSEQPPLLLPDGNGLVRCHLADPDTTPGEPLNTTEDKAGATPLQPHQGGDKPLLQARELRVYFDGRKRLFHNRAPIKAVDELSLSIAPGRTLALVGESGCGKSTVAKAIMQLLDNATGEVLLDGQNLNRLSSGQLRRKRREFQIIFQDPYASLNPRMRVLDIIQEGMLAQRIGGDASDRKARVLELLGQVGLPAESIDRYPHEFSGGQRQRICIARALAVKPRLLICDEPTSALDVSIQAQVLNLLKALQDELGLAYLFITHDLSVVEYLADEVAVMYLGRIVERAPLDALLDNPCHPYTLGLLAAVPKIDSKGLADHATIQGEPPSPAAPPPGCHFSPRCPRASSICRQHYPAYQDAGPEHQVACHHWDQS